MYQRKERKRIEISYELGSYPTNTTQTNYVENEKTLTFFRDSVNAHIKFNQNRFQIISENIEIVKQEIEYVETVGKKYESDCMLALDIFNKAIDQMPKELRGQIDITLPTFHKFGGYTNCDQLLILLNAELLEFKEDLQKYEVRLKILNHNLKTVNKIYG